MTVLIPLLKLVLCSGLLYGYYHFFLRNRRFHTYNRFYLMGSALLSMLVPFLDVPAFSVSTGSDVAPLIKTLAVINGARWEETAGQVAAVQSAGSGRSAGNILLLVYLSGVAVCLLNIMRSLLRIAFLKRKYRYMLVEGLRVYATDVNGTPFSFFSAIFWDKTLALDDAKAQPIFRHEQFHAQQRHSGDLLLMEALCAAAWLNPFYYLMKKELKALHEFLADAHASKLTNSHEYAQLLLTHAIQQKTNRLTHPFFYTQLKRRIIMITQKNLIQRSGYFARLLALPLIFAVASAFVLKFKGPAGYDLASSARKTLTVVIDPGHGGKYTGGRGYELSEKDLTLRISQKIKELSPAYDVTVVLTRNADQQVGDATNLKDDLQNRVNIANAAHADLFLSIHINADVKEPSAKTGFDVYVSSKNVSAATTSFASALLGKLKDIYATNEVIQSREIGVFVLDRTACPAAIVECGYITNESDAAFISSSANQEIVARKILEAIVAYNQQQ